jgi:hypothetical protein
MSSTPNAELISFHANELVEQSTHVMTFSTIKQATGFAIFVPGSLLVFKAAVEKALAASNSGALISDLSYCELGNYGLRFFLPDPRHVKSV